MKNTEPSNFGNEAIEAFSNMSPNEELVEDIADLQKDPSSRLALKDWTAQDFSNIYTRFRPHLERHASRFLRNQSQIDEVVQDAFLYLMVTLPELDSEIGVLRFLKWKTRLLCLDVIRASGRVQLSNIDAHPEIEAANSAVSADIEKAEDAAIVRLALSKLNPRHREVLLAAIYEEKTSAQIAAQVGLTENATNQLIFRARAAFKKALLGDDIDTSGMSTAKILSVAARKAALEAKKVGAQAMVFALFLILGVGAVFSFSGRNTAQISAAPEQTPASTSAQTSPPSNSEVNTQAQNETSGKSVQIPRVSPVPQKSLDQVMEPELMVQAFVAANLASVQNSQITKSDYFAIDSRQTISVVGEALSANFEFQTTAEVVSSLVLRFDVEDETYKSFPYGFKTIRAESGKLLVLGQLGYFVDHLGRIVKNNDLQAAGFEITLLLDSQGLIYSAEIQLKK